MLDCITSFICPAPLLNLCCSSLENEQNDKKINFNAKSIETESSSHWDTVWVVVEKVKEVAILVLSTLLTALFFYINPSLFAVGFIAGIIFDDKIEETIQKIRNVWGNLGYVWGLCACVLTLPVSFAAASMLWSARLGALLSKEYPLQEEKKIMLTEIVLIDEDGKNQTIPVA